MLAAWKVVDSGVTRTNRARKEAYIWRATDEEDTGIIADALLRLGQRHMLPAQLVRSLTITHTTYGAASIIFRNAALTFLHYVRNGGLVMPALGGLSL